MYRLLHVFSSHSSSKLICLQCSKTMAIIQSGNVKRHYMRQNTEHFLSNNTYSNPNWGYTKLTILLTIPFIAVGYGTTPLRVCSVLRHPSIPTDYISERTRLVSWSCKTTRFYCKLWNDLTRSQRLKTSDLLTSGLALHITTLCLWS